MNPAWAGVIVGVVGTFSGLIVWLVRFGYSLQKQLLNLRQSNRAIAATMIPIALGLGYKDHLSELRRAAGYDDVQDDGNGFRRRFEDMH